MAREEVHVRISKEDGEMSFECNGFSGKGCDVINQIEESLGTVEERKSTDEAYQYELHTPNYQETMG